MFLSEAAESNDVAIKSKICSGKMSKQNIERVPVHAHEFLYIYTDVSVSFGGADAVYAGG